MALGTTGCSPMQTCRANDINTYDYLKALFEELPLAATADDLRSAAALAHQARSLSPQAHWPITRRQRAQGP
jgi:hypothetical protein